MSRANYRCVESETKLVSVAVKSPTIHYHTFLVSCGASWQSVVRLVSIQPTLSRPASVRSSVVYRQHLAKLSFSLYFLNHAHQAVYAKREKNNLCVPIHAVCVSVTFRCHLRNVFPMNTEVCPHTQNTIITKSDAIIRKTRSVLYSTLPHSINI